jgi:DNA-binding transcriptional LysR family regulator
VVIDDGGRVDIDDGGRVGIDVERLRWFVAVAEELHFGRAAAGLNVSRLALSASVTALESELQTELFVPGAQPTELTDAGRELLERARPIIATEERRLATLPPEPTGPTTLTVGYVPGVTVTKWARVWAERFRSVRLDLVAVEELDAEPALRDQRVEMCFVRLPVDSDGLNVIPLYREVPVVIVPKDHPASLFEEVTLADLADEELLDYVDPADAVDLVAGGAGIVIVPQSVARSYSRRDLVYRPVSDAPDTQIALAWPVELTSDLTEEFVGVVRGRSANSSRSPSGTDKKSGSDQASKSHAKPAKKSQPAKAGGVAANRPTRGSAVGGKRPKRRGR